MGIVGAFILPHGSMILDPKKKGISNQAIKLHYEMKKIGKIIKELSTDIIFLTTPHSIALSYDYGMYLNKIASGTAEWNGEYGEFSIDIRLSQELSTKLLNFLQDKKNAVQGISAYSSSVSVPLQWGEVVPLWFLKDVPLNLEYIILSQPLRRLEHAKSMIAESISLGTHLKKFFGSIDKRVALIISADLSHTHEKEGPYGFSEVAETFDELIQDWAASLNSQILTEKIVPILDKAMCCGLIGFSILQGMIGNDNFKPNVLIRESPSYYGMMVASYLKLIQ
jgi:aromatic ring-opening dioxygenase LigB subunit